MYRTSAREAPPGSFSGGEDGFSTTGSNLVSSVAGPVSRPARRYRKDAYGLQARKRLPSDVLSVAAI